MATALVALSLFSAGAQMYSGYQAQKASNAEAKLQQQQALLADLEARREADKVEAEADTFRRRQKMAYLKSGVAIEGSPLLILDETSAKAQEEADAIRDRGRAQYNLGMAQAKQTYSKGRSAMIGSVVSALGSISNTYIQGTRAGIFSKASSPVKSAMPSWLSRVPIGGR